MGEGIDAIVRAYEILWELGQPRISSPIYYSNSDRSYYVDAALVRYNSKGYPASFRIPKPFYRKESGNITPSRASDVLHAAERAGHDVSPQFAGFYLNEAERVAQIVKEIREWPLESEARNLELMISSSIGRIHLMTGVIKSEFVIKGTDHEVHYELSLGPLKSFRVLSGAFIYQDSSVPGNVIHTLAPFEGLGTFVQFEERQSNKAHGVGETYGDDFEEYRKKNPYRGHHLTVHLDSDGSYLPGQVIEIGESQIHVQLSSIDSLVKLTYLLPEYRSPHPVFGSNQFESVWKIARDLKDIA